MKLSDFKDIHTHNLDAGPEAIINLPQGMDIPSDGYYSVGIHPWDTETTIDNDLDRIASLACDPRIVAIGEAGLDALRGAPLDRQEQIFIRHVRISESVGKPLIIHAVRTLSDIMRLRRQLRPKQQWVIHGFRGKPETARQLIALGIDISIGERHHPAVPDSVAPDHLFRETD